jgi:ankyrin repeat protein
MKETSGIFRDRVCFIGPGQEYSDDEVSDLKRHISGLGILTFGNGARDLDDPNQYMLAIKSEVGIAPNTTFDILSHGRLTKNIHHPKHQVLLHRKKWISSEDFFMYSHALYSETPVTICLWSCFSGSAAKYVNALAPGSIVTGYSRKNSSRAQSNQLLRIIKQIEYFRDNGLNFSFIELLALQMLISVEQGLNFAIKLNDSSVKSFSFEPNFDDVFTQDSLNSYFSNCINLVIKELNAINDEGNLPSNLLPLPKSAPFFDPIDIKSFTSNYLVSLAMEGKTGWIEKASELKLLDSQDHNGNTALIYATGDQNHSMIKMLLEHGANPNISTSEGCTPLICSTLAGDIESVKLLIEHSANVNTAGKNGTALIIACYRHLNNIAKFLLNNGADVNFIDSDNLSPLLIAIYFNNTELCQLLINAGADINFCTCENETPILAAVREGNLKIVRMLINMGANLEARDKEGASALDIALSNKNSKIVRLLINSNQTLSLEGLSDKAKLNMEEVLGTIITEDLCTTLSIRTPKNLFVADKLCLMSKFGFEMILNNIFDTNGTHINPIKLLMCMKDRKQFHSLSLQSQKRVESYFSSLDTNIQSLTLETLARLGHRSTTLELAQEFLKNASDQKHGYEVAKFSLKIKGFNRSFAEKIKLERATAKYKKTIECNRSR